MPPGAATSSVPARVCTAAERSVFLTPGLPWRTYCSGDPRPRLEPHQKAAAVQNRSTWPRQTGCTPSNSRGVRGSSRSPHPVRLESMRGQVVQALSCPRVARGTAVPTECLLSPALSGGSGWMDGTVRPPALRGHIRATCDVSSGPCQSTWSANSCSLDRRSHPHAAVTLTKATAPRHNGSPCIDPPPSARSYYPAWLWQARPLQLPGYRFRAVPSSPAAASCSRP